MFYLYNILIGRKVESLNKTFTYYYDDDSIKKGMRVKVDFASSKDVISLVISDPILINVDIKEYEKENGIKLKKISSILDEYPLITESLFKLAYEISNYYKCPLISVFDTFLPPTLKPNKSSINKPLSSSKVTYILPNGKLNTILNNKESNLYEKIKKSNGIVLSKITARKTLESLLLKGVLKKEEKSVDEITNFNLNKLVDFDLSKKQEESYSYLINSDKDINLLYGVTGSGKTAVYIKLIDYYLKENKSVIVLIPEISLTNQNANIFISHYKDELAVINSSLTSGKKYEQFKDILFGKKKVILGTRSAIFSPVKNLGLIIIDEEHSSSYKQDKTPFYDARKVSSMLANITGCKVVLGSATPSLLTMAKARKGIYGLTILNSQYLNVSNRTVSIIDLNDSNNFNPYLSSIISIPLKEKIEDRLNKKEQVLILINRRGYSPICLCSNCNQIIKCPNCNLPLVYHKRSDLMKCHHCNYQISKSEYKCFCGEKKVNVLGFGTERIDLELKSLFPNAKISHLDSDVCSKKTRNETLYLFSKGDIDILVGTQLLSKGHDYLNVTLAGIVDIDVSLNIPSYLASENTFDLISQFVGRAGRGDKKAEVIIQTMAKDNLIINYGINQDYEKFYQYEMNERKKYKYPPYTYLTMITLRSYDEKLVNKKIKDLRLFIGSLAMNKKIDVIGPIIPYNSLINGKYSRQILLKYKSYDDISEILDDVNALKIKEKDYEIIINVDPVSEI